MRLTMPMRFITSTAFSQSAWKAGSFASRSMGPKPCLPPRSWTPFMALWGRMIPRAREAVKPPRLDLPSRRDGCSSRPQCSQPAYTSRAPRRKGVVVTIAQAPLTEIQKQVLARIDDDEVVRLASDLIRIPSFTTEETPCADWLANYLRDQGLAAELQEIEPGRKQAVARLRGAGGGRSIMLNGHIDIDPLASGWTRDPFQPWIADGKIFGHGVYNMKAGETACIMAALALKRSGVPLRGDVVIACVAAELNSGIGTIHALEHGQRTDMAVVAEPYGA